MSNPYSRIWGDEADRAEHDASIEKIEALIAETLGRWCGGCAGTGQTLDPMTSEPTGKGCSVCDGQGFTLGPRRGLLEDELYDSD